MTHVRAVLFVLAWWTCLIAGGLFLTGCPLDMR